MTQWNKEQCEQWNQWNKENWNEWIQWTQFNQQQSGKLRSDKKNNNFSSKIQCKIPSFDDSFE